MTKFWACCEIRAEKHEDYNGYAYLVEWPSLRVIDKYVSQFDTPWSAADRKGIRQTTRVGDEIFVLWNNCIQVVDANTFTQERMLTTDVLLGGHVLVQEPGCVAPRLWYNSNVWNMYLCLDECGRVVKGINPYGTPLRDEIGIDPAPEDCDARSMDENDLAHLKAKRGLDQLHLNSFQIFDDGRMVGGSCTRKTMFELAPDPHVLLFDDELDCPHDFAVVGDRYVVNDSGNGALVVYDRRGNRLHNISLEKYARYSSKKIRPNWTRGMLVLDDERVLVGSAPLSVFQVNIAEGSIEDYICLAKSPEHTCHGLSVYE